MMAVSNAGFANATLTNVQVLATRAGMDRVSRGEAQAAVSSKRMCRSLAAVATVLFTHNSRWVHWLRSKEEMFSVTRSLAAAAAAMTSRRDPPPCFLSRVWAVWVKSASVVSSHTLSQLWMMRDTT